jgi:hypothetical protein
LDGEVQCKAGFTSSFLTYQYDENELTQPSCNRNSSHCHEASSPGTRDETPRKEYGEVSRQVGNSGSSTILIPDRSQNHVIARRGIFEAAEPYCWVVGLPTHSPLTIPNPPTFAASPTKHRNLMALTSNYWQPLTASFEI